MGINECIHIYIYMIFGRKKKEGKEGGEDGIIVGGKKEEKKKQDKTNKQTPDPIKIKKIKTQPNNIVCGVVTDASV